ncbi:unnamed protein product [Anisakis simplex]|uniref:Uncharacterized protein n=1 Tax=Anisakis simplex TaxID=6269 RepID=A0A0M3IY95_ANISI|nr:unnamed protein product [Anisakis simplex]
MSHRQTLHSGLPHVNRWYCIGLPWLSSILSPFECLTIGKQIGVSWTSPYIIDTLRSLIRQLSDLRGMQTPTKANELM